VNGEGQIEATKTPWLPYCLAGRTGKQAMPLWALDATDVK
jgi:hypothetical protein